MSITFYSTDYANTFNQLKKQVAQMLFFLSTHQSLDSSSKSLQDAGIIPVASLKPNKIEALGRQWQFGDDESCVCYLCLNISILKLHSQHKLRVSLYIECIGSNYSEIAIANDTTNGPKNVPQNLVRWWFHFYNFHLYLGGNDPIWAIFMKWVETTN